MIFEDILINWLHMKRWCALWTVCEICRLQNCRLVSTVTPISRTCDTYVVKHRYSYYSTYLELSSNEHWRNNKFVCNTFSAISLTNPLIWYTLLRVNHRYQPWYYYNMNPVWRGQQITLKSNFKSGGKYNSNAIYKYKETGESQHCSLWNVTRDINAVR